MLSRCILMVVAAVALIGSGAGTTAQLLSQQADSDRCHEERLRNPAAALPYCNRVLRTPDALPLDTVVATYLARGRAFEELNDLTAALADYNSATASNPSDGRPYSERGRLYANRLGDDEKAVHEYTQWMKYSASIGPNTSFRGKSYFRLGRYDAAIKDYSDAVVAFANNPEQRRHAIKDRADAWFGKGDFARAAADYQDLLSQADSNQRASLLFSLGITYYYLQLWGKAKESFDQVLGTRPSPLAAMWSDRVAKREGRTSRQLEALAQTVNGSSYGEVLARYFLNRASPPDVLRAASQPEKNDASFVWLKNVRTCSMKYYIAIGMVERSEVAQASRIFDEIAVPAQCPFSSGAARAELASLKK